MTPASILVRAADGRIRVARFLATATRFHILRYTARPGPGLCRRCGCTDRYACAGGCSWANRAQTLCSRCVGAGR